MRDDPSCLSTFCVRHVTGLNYLFDTLGVCHKKAEEGLGHSIRHFLCYGVQPVVPLVIWT